MRLLYSINAVPSLFLERNFICAFLSSSPANRFSSTSLQVLPFQNLKVNAETEEARTGAGRIEKNWHRGEVLPHVYGLPWKENLQASRAPVLAAHIDKGQQEKLVLSFPGERKAKPCPEYRLRHHSSLHLPLQFKYMYIGSLMGIFRHAPAMSR